MYHPNYYLENYICQEQSYFSGSSIILDIKLASLGLLIELMLLSCNSALLMNIVNDSMLNQLCDIVGIIVFPCMP